MNVVTTRAWILAALGVVVMASAGVGSLLLSRAAHTRATDSSPFPIGQVFTRTEWSKVTTALVARGFDRGAVQVVSGLRLQSRNRPFALIRATSASRGLCFIPVRGLRPGTATCSSSGHLRTPLLVYGVSDRWNRLAATEVVGIAQRSVAGVSIVDHRGMAFGVALIPTTGGLWSFAGGYGDAKLVVRARLTSGRITTQTTLP
jgi:hypothetical protein